MCADTSRASRTRNACRSRAISPAGVTGTTANRTRALHANPTDRTTHSAGSCPGVAPTNRDTKYSWKPIRPSVVPRSPNRRPYTAQKIRATEKTSPSTTRSLSSAPSDTDASATGSPSASVTACAPRRRSRMAKVAAIDVIAPATRWLTSAPAGASTARVSAMAPTVRSPAVSRSSPGSDAARWSRSRVPDRRPAAFTPAHAPRRHRSVRRIGPRAPGHRAARPASATCARTCSGVR